MHIGTTARTTTQNIDFEPNCSYDPGGYIVSAFCQISCTTLLQAPAELNQTAEQILHSHSAPCAFPEYTKKNQLCFVSA